ncbi:MAG: 23S rRNA (pseudouridine(1915)-N(3))-methyltransferase RlmH [Chitinivibrionales bacterium]|nr:23S rRNA (pseudouridine(1915)-N(3))-methyltransferase RlmH [Chitinivibrionales bacterium]MBD3356720.1 23S rRNA (pseudouridine(1915)-N(3))-methyltransferase RlmH [Chitinivibrionales bacterium]
MTASIHIICIGKEKRLVEGETERYIRLLSPYSTVRLTCLKPSAGGKGDDKVVRVKEGELMRSRWANDAYPVALSEEGTMRDSTEFAAWIAHRTEAGGEPTFNIGGAYGLADEVKAACRETISLSRLTLPHRLCLTVLVEQLYRAFTILKGHPYHK